ncbi:potassium-transporting ATPase subunit C [Streptomyces sp. LE64]|uniref:potassium-transporting ATPase subunit C n=1 Tax=Streptomyces sp. LE64 TaxID=3448653 RepID=UPI004043464A
MRPSRRGPSAGGGHRRARWRPGPSRAVPGDAVTAGGSGLDPHISPAYARLQTARVAARRGLDGATVRELVAEHTTGRALGVLGEPVVNVVSLNATLDGLAPVRGA